MQYKAKEIDSFISALPIGCSVDTNCNEEDPLDVMYIDDNRVNPKIKNVEIADGVLKIYTNDQVLDFLDEFNKWRTKNKMNKVKHNPTVSLQ